MSITLTEKAVKEIKRVMEEQNFSADEYALEVGVAGGGCSGFQYKLGFKKKEEFDKLNSTVFNFEGVEIVVDNRSLLYIEGTTLDFYEDINRRGFVFNNPNAKRHCGCGNSFSA
jgi:iron-sulfur cluster assembly protein